LALASGRTTATQQGDGSYNVDFLPGDQVITVQQQYSAGANILRINNIAGLELVKGEFIRFHGTTVHPEQQSKVYVIQNVDITGGNQYIAIFPPLRSVVYNNARVTYGGNCIGRFRYDLDVQIGVQYSDGILQDNGTVRLIEAL
jgi:hypothetical protein